MAPLIETHDALGNLTSRRTEAWSYDYSSGESAITDVVWEDIEDVLLLTELPVEPVAAMWVAVAAQEPPSDYLIGDEGSSYLSRISVMPANIQTAGPAAAQVCDILALIPGLGLWMSPACDIMSLNTILSSIAGYFKTFRETRWAMYVSGRLFTVVNTVAANQIMNGAKRAVRDSIRFRKSG